MRATLGPSAPLYVHVDLDVLDPTEGQANRYAAAGGATAAALAAMLRSLGSAASALTLSAYDPALDGDGRVREAAFAAVEALLESVPP
jgi:arginase